MKERAKVKLLRNHLLGLNKFIALTHAAVLFKIRGIHLLEKFNFENDCGDRPD